MIARSGAGQPGSGGRSCAGSWLRAMHWHGASALFGGVSVRSFNRNFKDAAARPMRSSTGQRRSMRATAIAGAIADRASWVSHHCCDANCFRRCR
jgi:hypothetical protein